MSFLENPESLRIPFPDIEEATENFTTLIGKGGYGLVYKGELLLSGKLTTVAVKRLDGNVSGQGFKEFLTEIQMLTRYKHPNLIPLIGFCDQDNEKILIYEYAEHGSLDKYLITAENRSKLTWKRRINICVNAAHGLNYLHNEVAMNERVIHRDIKSANILLDQNWKAMISDLGLSKLGRANEKDTFLITNVSGTHGYCDPVYISSGILTKESDVYSFGVVLFEVLCGRLGFINVDSEHRFLSSLAQRYYKKGKIDEIMDPALKNQIDSVSLNKFSEIASQCLQNNRNRRPSMHTVVKKLEELEKLLEVEERLRARELEYIRSYPRVEVEKRLRAWELEYLRRNPRVEVDERLRAWVLEYITRNPRVEKERRFAKTLYELKLAVQTRGGLFAPNGIHNSSSNSSLVKTKKRVHDIHSVGLIGYCSWATGLAYGSGSWSFGLRGNRCTSCKLNQYQVMHDFRKNKWTTI